MSTLWTRIEDAVAQAVGSVLGMGDYITWWAGVGNPFNQEKITVTGHVEDYHDGYVESVVSGAATSFGSTVTHVDGMAQTTTVIDGVRIVVWGVADRVAFDALARRLDADREVAREKSRVQS